MNKFIRLYVLVFCFFTIGCEKNEKEDSISLITIKDVSDNVFENQLIPVVSDFKQSADKLQLSINTFNYNPNLENLINAQNEWKNVANSYAHLYAFNIGEIRKNYTHQLLYNWPCQVSTVENVLETNEDISKDIVDTVGTRAKTLGAIEYLLFKDSNSLVINDFNNSPKRKSYLNIITNDFVEQVSVMHKKWIEEGYATFLKESTESGLEGTFNMLFNGFYNIVDAAKVAKVGKAAGLEKSSNTDFSRLQAPFSEHTLTLVSKNVKAFEEFYFSEFKGVSLKIYVEQILSNSEVSDALLDEINNCYYIISQFKNQSLKYEIENNHDLVVKLHESLNNIKILIAVDLRSVLNIVITSTDNDGD